MHADLFNTGIEADLIIRRPSDGGPLLSEAAPPAAFSNAGLITFCSKAARSVSALWYSSSGNAL